MLSMVIEWAHLAKNKFIGASKKRVHGTDWRVHVAWAINIWHGLIQKKNLPFNI